MQVEDAALRQQVDWKRGLISPSINFDLEIYRLEQERIFGRSWLFVAHEDMVRKPGDYLTNYMGEQPVIVSRDAHGDIHVLANRCSHRGPAVCLFDRGNAKSFKCSYHGWTFDSAGKLIGVPHERDLYGDQIDHSQWGLDEAQVTLFHGLVFATFDKEAPPLERWLGEDVCWWLKTFVCAVPTGGLEVLPGVHRAHSAANWKLLAENFIGDDYHVFSATHVAFFQMLRELRSDANASKLLTEVPPAPDARSRPWEASAGYDSRCPLGLGMVVTDESAYKNDIEVARNLGPEAESWLSERKQLMDNALREYDVKPYGFMNGLLFPNFALMGYYSPMMARIFVLLHPRGVLEHEAWQWTVVEKNAPQVVKDRAIERNILSQYMAGLIYPDDIENFERIVEGSQASVAWKQPWNYQLQLNKEHNGPGGLPGHLGTNPSEVNQRHFYKVWLEMMERES